MSELAMVRVGDVLPFVYGGKMVPFQIVRIIDDTLHLRSCDLKWVSRCRKEFWLKQKAIIEDCREE